jgi:quercetin dioxygenase-like cupin family protein
MTEDGINIFLYKILSKYNKVEVLWTLYILVAHNYTSSFRSLLCCFFILYIFKKVITGYPSGTTDNHFIRVLRHDNLIKKMKIIDITQVTESIDKGVMVELLTNGLITSAMHITCKTGYVFGNHFHKYTTHHNYIISGKILLVTQIDNNEIIKTFLRKGEMYMITPMEKHAFFALEDTELLVLAKGPNGNEEFESDTYPLWEPLIR